MDTSDCMFYYILAIPQFIYLYVSYTSRASLVARMVKKKKKKKTACSAGDLGSTSGLGRSPGEGNGNPLQYLAWKIPWTEQSGRLQSMGLQRVGHD